MEHDKTNMEIANTHIAHPPTLITLSDESLYYIMDLVAYSSRDLIILEQVCSRFRRIAKDNKLWLKIAKEEWEVKASWDLDIGLL